MKKEIVLGTLFGDEGKGVTVQWRVREALNRGERPCVVRFSGGPQSAHNIVSETGIKHTCSSFGAGLFYGVDTAYIGGYFDPICFVNECKELESKGVQIPKIHLCSWVPFITPYDVMANLMDEKEFADGTCGKGINKTRIRMEAVSDRNYFNKPYLDKARKFHKLPEIEEYETMYFDALDSKYFKKYIVLDDCFYIKNYDILIFEGTQGMLLDEDKGFHPHTTPSKTGLNGVPDCDLKDAEVFFTMRAYLTRHGNGYTPVQMFDIVNTHEVNAKNDKQGEFKVGSFDFDLLRRSFDRHNIDYYVREYNLKPNIVMTCCDCIAKERWFFNLPLNKTYDWDYNKLDVLMKHQLSEFVDDSWGFYYSDNPNSIFHNGKSTLTI